MIPALDDIRGSLEGAVPSVIATCAPDGTPNVTYISQVHYVDRDHVALSFQFFNKTRENVLANPRVTVAVIDPDTAEQHVLHLRYLRTETEGPTFVSMKARLAGIASHEGMSAVFRLRGADIYRVESIERVPGTTIVPPRPIVNRLSALRCVAGRLAACHELGSLCDELMQSLCDAFAMPYAKLLLLDAAGRRLYTLASRGYSESGVGAEVGLGEGVIGMAAEHRVPIRITFMAPEYLYTRAAREQLRAEGGGSALEQEIPFHGLPNACSQLAVPLFSGGRLLGVLYVESPESRRFGYEDEDALVALAAQLGPLIDAALRAEEAHEEAGPEAPEARTPDGVPAVVRHYGINDTVFIDDDYLIKGVAGAIAWKLLREHAAGRADFTNRELRLDPSIRLPDLSENLEARLILLQRRLAERCDFIRIEKTGRGRFRLDVRRPLRLEDVAAPRGA